MRQCRRPLPRCPNNPAVAQRRHSSDDGFPGKRGGIRNLVGKNLTYIASGICGLEVFASRRVAYFLKVVGGCKAIKGDRSNRYVQTFSWLGSGVTGRMGVSLYL